MTIHNLEAGSSRNILELISSEQLKALSQRIINSGDLGRSSSYVSLLEHLVQCAIEARPSKEIEIAVSVLGRREDFDVSTDSTVRVYIHQLRKKLDTYYEKNELDSPYRIIIPKGQYTLAGAVNPAKKHAHQIQRASRIDKLRYLAISAFIAALLIANLFYMIQAESTHRSKDLHLPAREASESAVWQAIMDDDVPILLVMGDYYIFGELNSAGYVTRMIREFNVNSKSDLEHLQFGENSNINGVEVISSGSANYRDLNLSYIPEGSAYAVARVTAVLQQSGKSIDVKMMSDLSNADIRSNHIVYIGYVSALDKLSSMIFSVSGLAVGRSFDEISNVATGEYYTSDAGLPGTGKLFKDYGLLVSFPATSSTQLVVVAGVRDAGLMHVAKVATDINTIRDIETDLGSVENTDNGAGIEALFEVYGVDRLNFDAKLIYTNWLDIDHIWVDDRSPL